MTLNNFNGNVSALAGLWGVDREALDGYVALAQTGSVDDLVAYAERHKINLTRKAAERTVAHREKRAG